MHNNKHISISPVFSGVVVTIPVLETYVYHKSITDLISKLESEDGIDDMPQDELLKAIESGKSINPRKDEQFYLSPSEVKDNSTFYFPSLSQAICFISCIYDDKGNIIKNVDLVQVYSSCLIKNNKN